MLSIFCNTSLLRRPLVSVHVMESLAQCGAQDRRHVSTSATSFNSGRFRKIKPVTSSFLSRSSVKQIKETSNPAFGREFLDKTVEKLLQGKPKYKSSYFYWDYVVKVKIRGGTNSWQKSVLHLWSQTMIIPGRTSFRIGITFMRLFWTSVSLSLLMLLADRCLRVAISGFEMDILKHYFVTTICFQDYND